VLAGEPVKGWPEILAEVADAGAGEASELVEDDPDDFLLGDILGINPD